MKSPTLGFLLQELLKAQGEALVRMAAFFGEEELLELLENRDENRDRETFAKALLDELTASATSFRETAQNASFYASLQSTVSEIRLSEPLEFHLWAFPAYREIIEAGIPLALPLQRAPLQDLADQALKYGSIWLDTLHIPPGVFPQARAGVEPVWVRFRAQLLRSVGQLPFRQV